MYRQDWRDSKEEGAKPTRPSPLPLVTTSLYPLFYSYLASRNLNATLADHNEWYPTDKLDGVPRVVMPASSRLNAWPYYQARAMVDHPIRYRSPAVPRGDALMVVYPPTCVLGVVIVEGPMDALAAAEFGYLSIGLMGNKPSATVITHIVELIDVYADNKCYVIPDGDAQREGQELARTLWERGVICHIQPLRGFKDLAAMSHELRKSWFHSLTN